MAEKWIQKSRRKMERKGTVGALTRQAKRAGFKSALSFARHVLAHKNRYSKKTVQRALWAINANKSRRRR